MKPTYRKLAAVLAVLAAVAGAASVLVYTIVFAKANVTSDTVDTLMWAYASHESGSLFASDFAYAGFLPFGGALLMQPFVALFGVGYAAQTAGMVMFLLLFFAAVLFFARRMGLSPAGSAFALFSVCALVLCSPKFREMFCEHILYYSLFALFFMVGFALLDRLYAALAAQKKTSSAVCGTLAFLFFTAVASDGFQVAGLVLVPLCAAFFCERFFDVKTRLFSPGNLPACLCAALPLPAMALGFLLRTLLTGGAQFGYANASSVYDTMANMRDWTGKLASLLTEYFGLFDIRFTDNASLTDPLQLPALLRVLIAGALLLTLPALAVFYRKCGARLVRLFWATAAVCGVTLFLWFFGTISNAGWRLIPMVFSQFLLFSCAAVYACKSVSLRRFGALLCAGLALFGCVSFSSLLSMERTTAPAGKYQGLYDAVHGKGLRYGYGSFWVANALFVLSGGEVQTHNTGVSETGELVLEQYQQFPRDSAAYEQQDGSFLILLAADVGRFEKSETYRALAPYLTGTQTDAGLAWGCRIYFYSCDIAPYLAEG